MNDHSRLQNVGIVLHRVRLGKSLEFVDLRGSNASHMNIVIDCIGLDAPSLAINQEKLNRVRVRLTWTLNILDVPGIATSGKKEAVVDTGECVVLASAQSTSFMSRSVDSSVARSIQRSIKSFMRS